jgi:hypothetical protein
MLDVGIEKELHKDDASLVMHVYEATGVLKGRGVPARVRFIGSFGEIFGLWRAAEALWQPGV